MALRGPRSWKHVRAVIVLAAVVLIAGGWSGLHGTDAERPFHGGHAAVDDRSEEDGLIVQYSTYFATAGRCSGCHGHDTLGLAMVTPGGTDVNVADDWRSTMMGNSARDPFFRAKAQHEGLVDPAHQVEIENKCLGCHAPLAMHEEQMLGNPPFTMAMLDTSILGQDGVSCLACHQQQPDSAGHFFSGNIHFGPEPQHHGAQVYGPYPTDDINPAIMEFFVGFTPGYGEHIQDGRVCAGCHTLITNTADLQGQPTGGTFVEQATWHEWKNSIYPADQQTTCRGCHMPRIDDPVILASEYAFLNGHSPFGLHHLAGGNTFMLKLLKAHRVDLGIPATDVQFDSTIARTVRNLRSSVQLGLEMTDRTEDTAFVDLALVNRTGHKFPSGYPSRRAFVQLIALDASNDTVFQSGRWDDQYELIGHDPGYEPHHDVITAGDQVQIYELVMGDVNANVTTTLERAAAPLKDDRLVPIGFSTSHPDYDTTVIAGVPASDLDFDHDALGVEGNGGDIVHFHLPLHGYTGPLHINARIYYQPVPPGWNQEMFGFHGTAIDAFRDLYDSADRTPELVAEDSLLDNSVGFDARSIAVVRAFPNPSPTGLVHITGTGLLNVRVFDAAGRQVDVRPVREAAGWRCQLPEAKGTYLLLVASPTGERLLRVVR